MCLSKIAALFGAQVVADEIMELLFKSVETVCANSVHVEFAEHGYQHLEENSENEKRSLPLWEQLKELGNNFFENNKWTDAMNTYTKAIHINPNDATLYYQRALCEIRLSEFQLGKMLRMPWRLTLAR